MTGRIGANGRRFQGPRRPIARAPRVGRFTPRIVRVNDAQRFDFAFARAYRVPAGALGITPARAWVEVGPETLEAASARGG